MANDWRAEARAQDWSVGAAKAWKFAQAEAFRQRFSNVDPLHLLIGVCSLRKAVDAASDNIVGNDHIACLRIEHQALASAFAEANLDETRIRRAARGALTLAANVPQAECSPTPSPQLLSVFKHAGDAIGQKGGELVSVLQLLLSLLQTDDDALARFLARCRVDTAKLSSAVDATLQRRPAFCRNSQIDVTEGLQKSDNLASTPVQVEATPPIERVEFTQALSIDTGALSIDTGALSMPISSADRSRERLNVLCDLPLVFARESGREELLETIIDRLLAVIPGAKRGAILLRQRPGGKLILAAHRPAGQPSVSMTLAERAMNEGGGFIWQKSQEISASLERMSCMCGMYAPLVAGVNVLGVICVDNPSRTAPFEEEDLRLLLAVARYAALALANHDLREELHENAVLLSRLLTNFSPAVRENLLKRARQGRLRVGGETSEVTILCSDIRGFTRLTSGMDASEVVELLNGYLPTLVDIIFRFKGTVDKYIGDAILAVFGSPEVDGDHRENALRAAVEMQTAMAALSAERSQRRLPTCQIGIGIHCGEVLHGFIGCPERMEFTVIGSAVNIATRYCDGAEAGQILISPTIYQHAWRMLEAEPTSVQTKHEGQLSGYRVQRLW